MKLFIDMDGVLADFDSHYEAVFGVRPDRVRTGIDIVDWSAVRKHPDFYLNIPPMPDMANLWAGVSHLSPTLLTGIPRSVDEAAANKRAWAKRHLGDVAVICCPTIEKARHCFPGDVLIDDYPKYKHLWEQAGRVFIVHTSAADSLRKLDALKAKA